MSTGDSVATCGRRFTNTEVENLVEELQTSGRWPVLMFNVSYKMNGNR